MGSEKGKAIEKAAKEHFKQEHDTQLRLYLMLHWIVNLLGAIGDGIYGIFAKDYKAGISERMKPTALKKLDNEKDDNVAEFKLIDDSFDYGEDDW